LQAFSVLPFRQTTDLIEKLRAQNVAFEEIIIPDEIHDLLERFGSGPTAPLPNSPTAGWLPRANAIES